MVLVLHNYLYTPSCLPALVSFRPIALASIAVNGFKLNLSEFTFEISSLWKLIINFYGYLTDILQFLAPIQLCGGAGSRQQIGL